MNKHRRTTRTTRMIIAISTATLGVAVAGMTVGPDVSAAPSPSRSITLRHGDELRCLLGVGTMPCRDLSI